MKYCSYTPSVTGVPVAFNAAKKSRVKVGILSLQAVSDSDFDAASRKCRQVSMAYCFICHM